MKDIQVVLAEDEVKAVLQVLGNLPTSSNAWPLMQKIAVQLEASSKTPVVSE